MQADIREISGFLRNYAPTQLDLLQQRHPEAPKYFGPSGVPLGDANVDAAADAARVMLETVDGVASTAIADTVRKLKSARWLELGGSLLALLASGGVIGATLAFSDTLAAAVLAIVSFVANAVPLITGWLRGTVGGQGSVNQYFAKLRELTWDARALRADFSHAADPQQVTDLIKRANSLARELYLALSDLGYQPQFRPV